MQHDQAHAVQDPRVNPLDDAVVHFLVSHVPPPDQHVGLRQRRFAETVLGLVEGSGSDLEAPVAQVIGDRAVDALGIDRGNSGIAALVAVFVPDGDAERDHD